MVNNNESGNASTTQNPDVHQDWREVRREWRRERREARHRYPFHGLFLGLILVLLGTLFLFNQVGGCRVISGGNHYLSAWELSG